MGLFNQNFWKANTNETWEVCWLQPWNLQNSEGVVNPLERLIGISLISTLLHCGSYLTILNNTCSSGVVDVSQSENKG